LMLDWSLYANFSRAELACKCGCDRADMDPLFMDRLQAMRTSVGEPFVITSGFRCKAHNDAVSRDTRGSTDYPHAGHAADIRCALALADEIIAESYAAGMTGRGIAQKGDVAKRFVHVDDMPPSARRMRPTIWSY
jgi:zinc D-Ala-D-Ala carboxypeptidase